MKRKSITEDSIDPGERARIFGTLMEHLSPGSEFVPEIEYTLTFEGWFVSAVHFEPSVGLHREMSSFCIHGRARSAAKAEKSMVLYVVFDAANPVTYPEIDDLPQELRVWIHLPLGHMDGIRSILQSSQPTDVVKRAAGPVRTVYLYGS